MKENCPFGQPSGFRERKLAFEDENGFWYSILPKEIGAFGQVLIVVRKRDEDRKHITGISDPDLLGDKLRLQSIIGGMSWSQKD